MITYDGGPAFPTLGHREIEVVEGRVVRNDLHLPTGMLLLDYFAGQALIGMGLSPSCGPFSDEQLDNGELPSGSELAHEGMKERCPYGSYEGVASECYRFARAMLEERRRLMEKENE